MPSPDLSAQRSAPHIVTVLRVRPVRPQLAPLRPLHSNQMTHIALYNGLFFRLKHQKTLPIRGHDARYVQTIRP